MPNIIIFFRLRYVWIRYGALNPIFPSLVTETRTAFVSSDDQIALISIDRDVEFNGTIFRKKIKEKEGTFTGSLCCMSVCPSVKTIFVEIAWRYQAEII